MPGDIPPLYELIHQGKEVHRFKGLDELMEFKYGVRSSNWNVSENETGGKTMNLRRGALYAFLFGILIMLVPPLLLMANPSVIGFVRDTFGLGSTYFAVRAYLNFVTSGLINLVGFQAWAAAVILYGLSRNSGIPSTLPLSRTGGPHVEVHG